MRTIQIRIDERLLKSLDADPEVRRVGRSEVVRRAMADYLRRTRSMQIEEGYRLAYGDGAGLGDEWTGWPDEGT